jgi:hypothetical protein
MKGKCKMGRLVFGLTLFVVGMISGGVILAGINGVKAQAEQSEVLVNMQQMVNSQEASGDNLSYINGEIPQDDSKARQSFDKVMDSYLVMWNELPNLYQLLEDLEKQKTQVDPANDVGFTGVRQTYFHDEGGFHEITAGLLQDKRLYIRARGFDGAEVTVNCLGGMQHWVAGDAEGCVREIDGYIELNIGIPTDVDVDTHETQAIGWVISIMDEEGWATMAEVYPPAGTVITGGFSGMSSSLFQDVLMR